MMAEKQRDASSSDSLLKRVHVASPCAESWEAMPGGDTVRACDRCQHKVYNLSEMTAAEAETLLRETEGRLCVRFYRRADGTIMTKDCPVSSQVARQRAAGAVTAVAATVAFASSAALLNKPVSEQPRWIQWAMNALAPEPVEVSPMLGQITRQPIALPMAPTMGTPAPVATPEPSAPMMGEMVVEERPTMGKVAAVEPVMGDVDIKPSTEEFTMGAVASPR